MSRARGRQRGAMLLVALVLMAIVSIVAASVVRFSSGGIRVAVNEELRADAFQRAQSLIDMVLAVPGNLAIQGRIGETNCLDGVAGCSRNTLRAYYASGVAMTATDLAQNGDRIQLRRIAPDVSTPPRATGYSAVHFQSAYLQVESGFDGTGSGWGRAGLTEGVTAIVPMYGG